MQKESRKEYLQERGDSVRDQEQGESTCAGAGSMLIPLGYSRAARVPGEGTSQRLEFQATLPPHACSPRSTASTVSDKGTASATRRAGTRHVAARPASTARLRLAVFGGPVMALSGRPRNHPANKSQPPPVAVGGSELGQVLGANKVKATTPSRAMGSVRRLPGARLGPG